MSGVALVTRGMIAPAGGGFIVVCDVPVISSAEELKPSMTGTIPPKVPGPAGEPAILSASDLRPSMTDTSGADIQPPADDPTILSATDMRPVIRKAKEE